jgi:hypothetical protein
MTRRDWQWVTAAAFGLALAVTGLGLLDARRAERQLADLERSVCGVEVPPAWLAPLVPLLEDPASEGANRRQPAAPLLGAVAQAENASIYFEHAAMLWTLDRWRSTEPDGASSWPQAVGRWEQVAWAEGCRSARIGTQLVVARTLEVAPRRFVVVVVRRWRG